MITVFRLFNFAIWFYVLIALGGAL